MEIEKTLEKGGVASAPATVATSTASANKYDKQKPFSASLLVSQKITGAQSAKDVRHIEIDLEGSDLTYTAGDALGVWFKNDEVLVNKIITKLNLDANTQVTVYAQTISLTDALIECYELTGTHPAFVEGYATLTSNTALLTLSEDKNVLRDFANNHQMAVENLENELVLSSSFGIQTAVCLHLITDVKTDTPIILTDTGYLFPETYQFIDELTEKLNLNLKIYSAEKSNAWQEARYGKRR